ncbi:MAG: hypothetical protein IPM60_12755 [Rhodospirillales bacterium]|nr:hypothetical protein [Rhodospirillales bacterium]
MDRIQSIERQIKALSPRELEELRLWFDRSYAVARLQGAATVGMSTDEIMVLTRSE